MENMCKDELMMFLQSSSFALLETGLFLDTHPDCEEALEAFAQYKEMYEEAMCLYEKKYGPIEMCSQENDEYFTWVDGPWPWEMERGMK